ncbi:hypothetical protein DY000_02043882 [Brassica cretica]|uniref:Uncharacterized protein n=1 Tax=Brassica cretica TaxID=69181 RepID=A0ABQ7BDA2_BRACR|nr:hypothetical protein DY000_02043882 [Brassica cretica]
MDGASSSGSLWEDQDSRFGVLFTVSGLVGAKDKTSPIIAIPNVFGLFKPCTDNDSLHRKRLGMLGYEN